MRRQLSAALIAIATLSEPAMAAERNYTIRGEGWFDTGNDRFGRLPMREARLTLRDNGEFAVTLFVRNERYLVRGRWDRNSRSDIERIDINDAFGQRASGNGSLAYRIRGGQPVRLELDGRTDDGTFHATIVDPAEGETNDRERDDRRNDLELGRGNRLTRAINTTVQGSGTLRLSGIRDGRLEEVRVRMETNRDVRLEFSQPTRGAVRAEIVEIRDNRITARVSEMYGHRASGQVVIVMRDRDMVDRINGAGGSEGGSWQLDFAGRSRRDGGWNDDRDGGWNGGRRDMNERGNGWLRQDIGPSMEFDRVRVLLEEDRDALIQLDSRRQSIVLRGRWSGKGDVVRVELTQVNEMRARGALEVRREGGRLRLVEGDGRTDKGRFEVRFSR
ncbi:MAG: hypothetical protein H7066_05005 [Cytophagaceae bacterium]|nr:hypothetical protein [Gemmatimonadaceae bacterium]